MLQPLDPTGEGCSCRVHGPAPGAENDALGVVFSWGVLFLLLGSRKRRKYSLANAPQGAIVVAGDRLNGSRTLGRRDS